MLDARICPMPQAWERVRASLEKARAEFAPHAPTLPVPLVLAGWVYSTDEDKRQRWAETIAWVDEHGLRSHVPELAEADWYCGV